MPGPPPSLDPVRGNRRVGPRVLPTRRTGPPPPWPLGTPSRAEREVWQQLWSTPMSTVWEVMGAGTHRVLARYTRLVLAAERPDASPVELAAVLALEDRLGLTPKALRMLLWTVATEDVAPPHPRSSARGRLRAVT